MNNWKDIKDIEVRYSFICEETNEQVAVVMSLKDSIEEDDGGWTGIESARAQGAEQLWGDHMLFEDLTFDKVEYRVV